MYDLDHCRVCGTNLPTAIRDWAHQRYEPQTCSTECRRAEIKQRYACCDKAEFLPCVCMYSFRCPVHGDTHIGTHD